MRYCALLVACVCLPLSSVTAEFGDCDIGPLPSYNFRHGCDQLINPYVELLKPQGLRFTFKNMSQVHHIQITSDINKHFTGDISELIGARYDTEVENNMAADTVVVDDYLIKLKENDKYYFHMRFEFYDETRNMKISQFLTVKKNENGDLIVSKPTWDNIPQSYYDYNGTLDNRIPWHTDTRSDYGLSYTPTINIIIQSKEN